MTIWPQTRASTLRAARSLLVMGALYVLAQVCIGALFLLAKGVLLRQLPVLLTRVAPYETFKALVFVAGFLVAERAAISRGRGGPYTVVVLVATALVAALSFPLLHWLGQSAHPKPLSVPLPHQVLTFVSLLPDIGLLAFMYARHRERLDAAQAIQILETRRNEMMGRLAASRLEAVRAQVQPEAFIAELRALRSNYVEDSASADIRLDALITRLRAASRSAAP